MALVVALRALPPAGLAAGGGGLLLQIGPLPIHFWVTTSQGSSR